GESSVTGGRLVGVLFGVEVLAQKVERDVGDFGRRLRGGFSDFFGQRDGLPVLIEIGVAHRALLQVLLEAVAQAVVQVVFQVINNEGVDVLTCQHDAPSKV